jgi:putative membrane protein
VIQMMWWSGNGGGMNGWGYGLMVVGVVLFCGLLIFGVIAVVRYLVRGDRSLRAPPTPARVPAERCARGEIDEQEHRERSDTLRTLKPARPR